MTLSDEHAILVFDQLLLIMKELEMSRQPPVDPKLSAALLRILAEAATLASDLSVCENSSQTSDV